MEFYRLVCVGSRRLLVDCGQRMGGAVVDRLPDLGRVQALGPVDAIQVNPRPCRSSTLPILRHRFTRARRRWLALMRIMLADSLRIMQMKWDAGSGDSALSGTRGGVAAGSGSGGGSGRQGLDSGFCAGPRPGGLADFDGGTNFSEAELRSIYERARR